MRLKFFDWKKLIVAFSKVVPFVIVKAFVKALAGWRLQVKVKKVSAVNQFWWNQSGCVLRFIVTKINSLRLFKLPVTNNKLTQQINPEVYKLTWKIKNYSDLVKNQVGKSSEVFHMGSINNHKW